MRVIAGKFRSRLLHSPRGADIRPTADRLRETLFDVLTAGNPNVLDGTIWFDLYAGTGAVGIEALSRGAGKVYFVEMSKPFAELIRRNLTSLEVEEGFEILRQDVVGALRVLNSGAVPPDFVFLDPPYRMEQAYGNTLEALAQPGLLRPQSLVIVEHRRKYDPEVTRGTLQRYRKLEQGDAALSFYRLG